MIAFVYDVHVEMLHPVRARPGCRLVVRPGHPERPVVVVQRTADGWAPVRLGPPNYGALVGLETDGAITLLAPSAASLDAHPLVHQHSA